MKNEEAKFRKGDEVKVTFNNKELDCKIKDVRESIDGKNFIYSVESSDGYQSSYLEDELVGM